MPVTQSRRASAVEACCNVALGYIIAIGAQMLIFPHFGINVSMQDNLAIGAAFTVVSLVRSYVLRRVFNAISSYRLQDRECGHARQEASR